ncbi:MAG: hypothetical protein IJF33_07060 [Clostridia bacterium]|nr:hypothetical protein [Clostridia bacterium]
MKKTNLIILLVFPFLIALVCIITVNSTYNRIDVDISYIDWEYNDMEGFRISDTGYPLRAVGVNQRYYAVSGGNELIWRVENKTGDDSEPCAEVYESNGTYYLKAIREGEVVITCSNQKGNVHRQMTGVIYENAAILFYPTVGSSQTNIDQTIYYGQYDHERGNPAKIDMTMFVVPHSDLKDLIVETVGSVHFDEDAKVIEIDGPGKASVTLSLASVKVTPVTFSFEVVENGVNVYTYEDLLYCTNRSETGEIAVLRKSFESLQNAYLTDSNGEPVLSGGILQKKANNVECFGNYDPRTKTFSFDLEKGEIDSVTTTYNRNFIDQWNAFVKTNANYSEITDQVLVGLHVQKDFYGNGYTINMHNLTYPYASIPMLTNTGETVHIPQLTKKNLFRGPLKMYTLGDPNNVPLVSLYGQDNVGMYVDGDGITVNDVNVKNCDFGDRLANLATVGTVMEVAGNGVTVKNSRISNGKNVMRSFSSMDLTLSNCMLSNAQNFLFVTGSNEYVEVDTNSMASFYALDGTQKVEVLEAFISPDGEGDEILNTFMTEFCTNATERENMRRALLAIQDAVNTAQGLQDNFKGSTQIEDCFFYRSGISSICMESLFNSPFLETAAPSMITDIFAIFNGMGKSLVPYTATNVSGISYPVQLNISGNTRFYDYKVANEIDLSGLIEENISAIANSVGIAAEIDIDTIFPLRSMLVQRANAMGVMRSSDGKSYINIPVAFYGGGLNLSEITTSGFENKDSFSGAIDVDLLDSYLRLSNSSTADTLKGLILKTVVTVTGFEPFSFHFTTGGAYFGETPKITDLIANSKGT